MNAGLGCIADDFTGAADLAALLARSGAQVNLRIGIPEKEALPRADCEVIALKCRTIDRRSAVAEARQAFDWLKASGVSKFFWKYCSTFDSTPKGNIGPIAEALMSDLGASQTIYCPAFPENGRSVFMGHLFVGRQLLSESPLKDHPLTPMRDSCLLRLLEPQVDGAVALIDRNTISLGPDAVREKLKELRNKNVANVIMDAIVPADLQVIAEACHDMPLLTGGSAIAEPLPKLMGMDSLKPAASGPCQVPRTDRKAVVLSGSCSEMSNLQVETYLKTGVPSYRLDPVEISKHGPGEVLAWLRRQDFCVAPLIYATAEPDRVRQAQSRLGPVRAGELVEQAISDCAVAAREIGVGRIVVAGGETSGAVTKALNVTKLQVGPEIAAGVPWCFSRDADQSIALALKSGNFGTQTFFSEALGLLDGGKAGLPDEGGV
ncbi:3-oxo-tetronate kinase [Roseibium sediminicola]|uniref:3-oxo-tetronate kinase n=1 Tax=Roseibium sediminicola TaxID=2933272 RepID=A0ABT0H3D3_9HYPH|nr:3-oxo-tetronate kinase [Roseibium sp. CAU 1639]MCK7616176.1 four-carbon acid sugar kinase family protein [Roseibium sp. CAU 1639]